MNDRLTIVSTDSLTPEQMKQARLPVAAQQRPFPAARACAAARPRGRSGRHPWGGPSRGQDNPAMLPLTLLRPLTVDPATHPRGQPHLSAASGLVCAQGRVHVVADDELHLGVFDDAHSPGRLLRLFDGALPAPK